MGFGPAASCHVPYASLAARFSFWSLSIIQHIMKHTFAFILLTLLLAACSRQAQIVGTWHQDTGTAALVFNADGSFASSGGTDNFSGTWQISDKVLTFTFTNMSAPHQGSVKGGVRCKIIRIDSHVLSYDVDGQTNSFHR